MTGNDIIDLRQAATESNWQRQGYLQKVYTAAEQSMILRADLPGSMVWLLWSCKEAVYKIVNRQTRVRAYAPQQFVCTALDIQGQQGSGLVAYKGKYYPFRSIITTQYIHTVAVAAPELFDITEIFTAEHDHADDYMPILKNAHIFKHGEVLAKDQYGVPYLWNKQERTQSPVSISHHGRYFGMVNQR